MSPDIEWQVGEAADQETIARITTSKPSRWRKPIVLLMAAVGLGLGALYASIPEPLQPIAPPTPIATPLPPTPALTQTIDREARALANGDRQTFSGLLDPQSFAWRQEQISSFTPWGAPSSDAEFYRILDSGQLDAQHAWADVIQARAGKFFRQTRFYRLHDGAWLRTASANTSDSGAVTVIATRYFQLTTTAEDEDSARLLAGYLAHQSREVCHTFGCNFEERAPVVHFLVQPEMIEDRQRSGLRDSPTMTVTLPSPRLAGYYTTDFDGVDIDDENWDRYFDRYLYFPLLYTAVGGAERWQRNRDGLMYLYAVGFWDLTRRGRTTLRQWQFPYRPEMVTDMLALSADARWNWPVDASPDSVRERLANASALVQFIDETYGADTVLRFFRTLRFAQSLPHALSRSGVPLDEFEQKWQAWQNHES
jgi:hypothetical protein